MVLGPAISSMSLGRAWVHNFKVKMDAACKYGYKGLELFYEDLAYIAKDMPGGDNPDDGAAAALEIRGLCDYRGIKIISLQPFYDYEGLRNRDQHQERIRQLHEWFEITIIDYLHEVASFGLAQRPPVRFCYEGLAWGTYIHSWQHSWSIVKRVDMPNLGICLDAFNILGLIYTDLASSTGRTPDTYSAVDKTLRDLKLRLDPQKLFLVQMADAERLTEPLKEGHEFLDEEQPARMSWSRNCRLFYGEVGGYLPVHKVMRTILHDLGYRGWVSAELFNRRMTDPKNKVPEEIAKRGKASWQLFNRDMGLYKIECIDSTARPALLSRTSSQIAVAT